MYWVRIVNAYKCGDPEGIIIQQKAILFNHLWLSYYKFHLKY